MAGLFVKKDAGIDYPSAATKALDRKWFPLVKAETVIGRDSTHADIILPAVYVSRTEARIAREGEAYYLENITSRNATCVHGRSLRLHRSPRHLLSDGDEIKVGDYLLVFLERDPNPSAEAVKAEPTAAPDPAGT